LDDENQRRIGQVMLHVWGMRNAYKIFVRNPEGTRPLTRPRHTWENNIKIHHRKIGWEGMD
jgi:hypothetical protein